MRPILILSCLLLVESTVVFAQTVSTKVAGVAEPPELIGEAKKVTQPSKADEQFLDIGISDKPDEVKAALPKLDGFIAKYSDYPDAYFLRATYKACILNSDDFLSIENDVNKAISLPNRIYNNTDYYSLLGKIALQEGKSREAMNDLEKAMRRDLDTADKMFNIGGVVPEKTSQPCVWNLTDLDGLIASFPKDYRPSLFRGLYYLFFTTFKEDYYPRVMSDFQRAALLNPTSPLPQYFIGEVYSKASFWTKKAWASDAGRDEQIRNAAQAYTRAIRLDSNFLHAYEHRAGDYLNLKRYPEALRDYEKILALDPDNAAAHSDRGLARFETGAYVAAISDFGDAIRLKKDDDSYLPTLYENRGDAQVKLSQYRDAIADYSKAIALNFGRTTILLSLKQMRALYPEYDGVSDEVLSHRIHDLFWPNMDYSGFGKQIDGNGKWEVSFLLSALYQKRGDAYLKAGDYRHGTLDFKRIFHGIPNMAGSTDRWRSLGSTPDEEYFIDVKSTDFPPNAPVQIWIKKAKKKTSEKLAYQIDCKAKRISQTSFISYDATGNVANSSDYGGGWQVIVPDTLGEQLFNGACSLAH
jgi:tetratricopeptide (TPR) repeat protein